MNQDQYAYSGKDLVLTKDLRLYIDLLSISYIELIKEIENEIDQNPFLYIKNNFFLDNNICDIDLENIEDHRINNFRHYLMSQVFLDDFNILEKAIAEMIIFNLNDDGFLNDYDGVKEFIFKNLSVFPEWIESVRKKIMALDPIGCGSLDIKEAIAWPVFNLKLHNILIKPAKKYLEKCQVETINIIPEIVFYKYEDKLMVSPINSLRNYLFINEDLIKTCDRSNHFVSKKAKKAYWFIKALEQRDNYLAIVANGIAYFQREWLLGQGPLRPLKLKQIADHVGLHQSTISRLVSHKYCQSIYGTHNLKYFFQNSIPNKNHINFHSSASVKDNIKLIIFHEDKKYPLSDQKIQNKLEKIFSIKIARRTVTKYRKDMRIMAAKYRKVSLYDSYF